MEMFEKSTLYKFRFKAENGIITVEDLWDLPLTQLDTIAKNLRKELRDVEDSFIDEKVKPNNVEERFDIVKYIISKKLEMKASAIEHKEKLTRKQKIMDAIETRHRHDLQTKSIEELMSELKEL